MEPGDLMLVAGKALVATAKAGGAVAIDIGGQIEALGGLPNGAMA